MIPIGSVVKHISGVIGVVTDFVPPPLVATRCRDGTFRITSPEHVTVCYTPGDF